MAYKESFKVDKIRAEVEKLFCTDLLLTRRLRTCIEIRVWVKTFEAFVMQMK
jgi:hypothetical protein